MANLEIDAIKETIRAVGERKAQFSASDVRDALGREPSNPNFIGCAFRALKAAGEIFQTGDATSRTGSRHGGHVSLWRSAFPKTSSSLTAWF